MLMASLLNVKSVPRTLNTVCRGLPIFETNLLNKNAIYLLLFELQTKYHWACF